MAGLFPPGTARLIDSVSYSPQPGLPNAWQLVPVHTLPVSEDDLLIPWHACQAFIDAMEARHQDLEWQRVSHESADTLKFVSQGTGLKDVSLDNIHRVNDAIVCARAHNRTLPTPFTP